jgi:hypothetical protein
MALPGADKDRLERVKQPGVQGHGLQLRPGLAHDGADRDQRANIGIAELTLPRLIAVKLYLHGHSPHGAPD